MSDEADTTVTETTETTTAVGTEADAAASQEAETKATETKAPASGRGEDGKFKGKPAVETASWREGLDDDLRKVADKFGSPTDILKSYNELEKNKGRSILRPGKNATDEERAAFTTTLRKELGWTEKADDYKVELPAEWVEDESTQEWVQSYLEAMHKEGAPISAAAAGINLYRQMVEKASKDIAEHAERHLAEAEVSLRREWGADFEPNKAIGLAAFAKYADDDLIKMQAMTGKELGEALGDKRIGDHPAWLRLFSKFGRATGESRTIFRETHEGQDLLKQALDLKRTPEYQRRDRATVERVEELLRRHTGEQKAA